MPALVIPVDVHKPSTMKRNGSAAPTSPGASSPKGVRFPSDEVLVTASRQRTEEEAWSFYWFEMHCRQCTECMQPYHVYKRGDHLCSKGEVLARNMAVYIVMRDGQIYERHATRGGAPDRVEIPHGYSHLQGQLKALEKMEKHHKRRHRHHHPVVEHDQTPSRRSDERRREDRYYTERHRETKPRSERRSEATSPPERAEIIINTQGTAERHSRDEGKFHRRKHRHSTEYKHEETKDNNRRQKDHLHVEMPVTEKRYRHEERYPRERSHRTDKEDNVEVETNREKKYRTEIRKPDKEYRNSYRH